LIDPDMPLTETVEAITPRTRHPRSSPRSRSPSTPTSIRWRPRSTRCSTATRHGGQRRWNCPVSRR
jgi:hypothetical protein